MDLTISPFTLQDLTSFYIAKLFWNKTFKAERLHLSEFQHNRERNWEIQLTIYQDEAIRNVNIFIEESQLTLPLKTILTESVFLLQEAYHQLLLWKLNYDKYNKIDIMQEGECYAPNFFNAKGKFNDWSWAKRLVQNRNYSTVFRFSLATAYDFQSDACNLWENFLPLEDIPLEDEFKIYGKSANFRLFKSIFEELNNQYQPNEDLEILSPSYFLNLVRNGCEYVIYAKWENLSNFQQLQAMMNDNYFELIKCGMDFPKCNISFFLYTRLSEDRRKHFFQWSLRQQCAPEMWLTLLFTSSGGSLYSEILELIHKLPISILSKLLQLLSRTIRQLRLPLDAELFETLWNEISPNKYLEILKNGKSIIENLVKATSFHNIGCIIKRLSLEQKHKCLLNGLYGAGINILYVLCKEAEFDLLQKYLSFFLIDVESHAEVYNLRRKCILLLNKFGESFEFQTWCINELSKADQTEVKSRMEAIK